MAIEVWRRLDNAMAKNFLDRKSHIAQQIRRFNLSGNGKFTHTHIPNPGIRIECIPQSAIHIKNDSIAG